ncbi:hypothetical protein SDC9_173879 [bioreactor metagenome]|uniref:Uncharacterized protein n=1 Tax=bioreactor metagenome TaxID=1076179 RepID=A0A645GR69_9ZZZZ
MGSEIEISLRVSGVDHIENEVDVAIKQFMERDPLFGRRGREAVNPRQVDDFRLETVDFANSGFPLHGHTGIVAHMLTGSGESIEYGAFPAIGVAGKSDPENFALHGSDILKK